MAKQRVFPPSLAQSPSAFPLRPASHPPSHLPACRQGGIPELKPLELGEGREGASEARGSLWDDAVIPAGGAWGKLRSGQAWPLGAALAGQPCRERSKETPDAAHQRHRPQFPAPACYDRRYPSPQQAQHPQPRQRVGPCGVARAAGRPAVPEPRRPWRRRSLG